MGTEKPLLHQQQRLLWEQTPHSFDYPEQEKWAKDKYSKLENRGTIMMSPSSERNIWTWCHRINQLTWNAPIVQNTHRPKPSQQTVMTREPRSKDVQLMTRHFLQRKTPPPPRGFYHKAKVKLLATSGKKGGWEAHVLVHFPSQLTYGTQSHQHHKEKIPRHLLKNIPQKHTHEQTKHLQDISCQKKHLILRLSII